MTKPKRRSKGLTAKQVMRAFAGVKTTLVMLDKAQRVTAQDLLLTVGPQSSPVRAGERCPLCGYKHRRLP